MPWNISRIEDPVTGVAARVEQNGGLAVNLQDQTTELIDTYFIQSVSNFTLAAPTSASTTTNLVYTFEATAGHGIIANDEIILLDVDLDKSFQAVVLNVAVNTITVDRPIDNAYGLNTIGRIVTSEMAVDGSVTPSIFTVRSGQVPLDITRMILTMLDGTQMDDGTFGGLPALTRGLVLRIIDGFNQTIFNFKTNGEIKQFFFDFVYADKAPAGQFGVTSRVVFGGQNEHGVVLRVSGEDVIQWVVQDDLTGLVSLKIAAQGHKVQEDV
jgi:hypothetical protein